MVSLGDKWLLVWEIENGIQVFEFLEQDFSIFDYGVEVDLVIVNNVVVIV